MASTADIKNGVVLSIDGQLWSVIEFQHVKPGKGGAFVRTKLKNVVSGKVVDRTYNAGAKIEIENVDRRDFTYLYNDGDNFVFMDVEDYDQINVGGGDRQSGPVAGIHWHMNLANEISYIATDNHRQVIPWATRSNVTAVHRADNNVIPYWVTIK